MSSQPLLAHNRIAQNHRNTIILLVLVPLLLLPFAASVAVWVAPWVLIEGMMVHRRTVEGWLGTTLENWFGTDPFWAEMRLFLIGAGITVAFMTEVTLLAALLYRNVLLGTTNARRLRPEDEPDLRRLVESLCIGTGIPVPQLYLIESPVPNAFATGRDPAHATLTLTRGLLTLLTPRELEGVVAHELAHIVNHDSRLNTAVAALIATLRVPIGTVTGIYRLLRKVHPFLGVAFLLGFFGFLGLLGMAMAEFFVDPLLMRAPDWVIWRQVFVAMSPFFILFGAPALGLFMRQAVSRQREYLADAEAVLLTRYPEGLAVALTKIGAWRGPGRLNLGPSAAHLCIVNPLPPDSLWWDRIFPCHPPIQDRVQLLARMGSGLDESVLKAAAEEGANAGRLAVARAQEVQAAKVRAAAEAARAAAARNSEPEVPVAAPRSIPVYEKPDGWSTVLCQLPEHAAVTVCGTEGNFLKITLANRVVGYISQSARDRVIAVPAS